ncbi:CRISPR-associated endonuclease Cas2 [Desulfobaculum senezii]
MPNISAYVVAYGVSDDKERHRVSKVFEGFGERVQGSVC